MKKDRNCGMYPVYPVPMGMNNMMPMPNNIQMPYAYPGMVNQNNDLNAINKQLNNLENRVSRLESIVNSNSKYNDSNYYMV